MMDTSIWRLLVGSFNEDGCDYDLDIEIVQRESPNTRSKDQLKLDMRLYGLVLIFTHKSTSDVRYLVLTPEEIEELDSLYIASGTRSDSRVGRFSLTKKGRETRFTLHSLRRDYVTCLSRGAADRIMSAIRVKKFLDRYLRLHHSDDERNELLCRDLTFACYYFTSKYTVDTLVAGKEVFPRPMSQAEYRTQCLQVFNDEFKASFLEDFSKILGVVQETLGYDWEMVPRMLDYFMRASSQSWNPYNEKLDNMTEEMLLVLGIWSLQMG